MCNFRLAFLLFTHPKTDDSPFDLEHVHAKTPKV